MLQKIKNWLYRFMYGRNGVYTLAKAVLILMIVIALAGIFFKGTAKTVIIILTWVLIIYGYFRMFSKNVAQRRKENAWFESKIKYLKTRFSQRKDYRFFDCPNCKTHLRVPRGVGNITITCKKCGTKFDRKA